MLAFESVHAMHALVANSAVRLQVICQLPYSDDPSIRWCDGLPGGCKNAPGPFYESTYNPRLGFAHVSSLQDPFQMRNLFAQAIDSLFDLSHMIKCLTRGLENLHSAIDFARGSLERFAREIFGYVLYFPPCRADLRFNEIGFAFATARHCCDNCGRGHP